MDMVLLLFDVTSD